MVVTKVDQWLVIEIKAAEAVSHCKALETRKCIILNRISGHNIEEQLLLHHETTLGHEADEVSHFKVYFGFSRGHKEAECWRINSTVALPEDEELVLTEVWELGEEILQGFVIILGNLW